MAENLYIDIHPQGDNIMVKIPGRTPCKINKFDKIFNPHNNTGTGKCDASNKVDGVVEGDVHLNLSDYYRYHIKITSKDNKLIVLVNGKPVDTPHKPQDFVIINMSEKTYKSICDN